MRSRLRREHGQIGKTLRPVNDLPVSFPPQNAFYSGECWGRCCEIEYAQEHGQIGKSLRPVNDLPVSFLRRTLFIAESAGVVAVRSSMRREHGQIGKSQKPSSMTRSAHAITHLIPEVRPFPGQRFALFKNAPGVFVPGVGRFPLLTVIPAR
ncbi:hypothetical protein ACVW03_001080 [Pantoea agglomerans]|jgi:hypothetical protein